MQQMNDLNNAARSLGVEMAAPFMTHRLFRFRPFSIGIDGLWVN